MEGGYVRRERLTGPFSKMQVWKLMWLQSENNCFSATWSDVWKRLVEMICVTSASSDFKANLLESLVPVQGFEPRTLRIWVWTQRTSPIISDSNPLWIDPPTSGRRRQSLQVEQWVEGISFQRFSSIAQLTEISNDRDFSKNCLTKLCYYNNRLTSWISEHLKRITSLYISN
jgi:hypothetical protein